MKWKLIPEEIANIREARRNGESVADLAEQYGVSRQSIYSHLGAAATKARRQQPPRSRVTVAAEQSHPYRDSTFGYIPRSCADDRCGQPPARGEATLPLVVYGADLAAVEICSWHCLSRHAIHRELAGGDAA